MTEARLNPKAFRALSARLSPRGALLWEWASDAATSADAGESRLRLASGRPVARAPELGDGAARVRQLPRRGRAASRGGCRTTPRPCAVAANADGDPTGGAGADVHDPPEALPPHGQGPSG
jgi:hypothetical protein